MQSVSAGPEEYSVESTLKDVNRIKKEKRSTLWGYMKTESLEEALKHFGKLEHTPTRMHDGTVAVWLGDGTPTDEPDLFEPTLSTQAPPTAMFPTEPYPTVTIHDGLQRARERAAVRAKIAAILKPLSQFDALDILADLTVAMEEKPV
jgi:hypothetical protein